MKLDAFPTFFKVISNVEYGDYDPFAGQFNKTITYKIKAYVVTDEIIDNFSYQRSITDVAVQTRRVENLVAGKFLRKKYEYYYTGGNTEVLEFDLKLDFAYYYIVPYGGGHWGDANVQNPKISKDTDEVIGRLREVTAARKRLASAHRSLNNANARPQHTDFDTLRKLKGTSTRLLKDFYEIYDENITYLETEMQLSPTDINYQFRIVQDVIGDEDLLTSDNDREGGALKMGAVKANLENAADLIQIELGIRGDPYWFGVPNSLYNQQRSVDELADFEAGAPSFFLQVNLPTSGEDGHGRRKPRPDYQLSGVYTVRNVINRFQGGQFTQYLGAIRDLATNVSTIWDLLSGDQSVIKGISDARDAKEARINQIKADAAAAQESAYHRVSPDGTVTGRRADGN